jgi:hypothetical protein
MMGKGFGRQSTRDLLEAEVHLLSYYPFCSILLKRWLYIKLIICFFFGFITLTGFQRCQIWLESTSSESDAGGPDRVKGEDKKACQLITSRL